MKNKILLILTAMFLGILTANAETDKIHVSLNGNFSTTNPSKQIDVNVLEDSMLGSYNLKAGDIIHCNVTKVTDPKRGKRSATFRVCPVSFTSDGNTTIIETEFSGKYAEKIMSANQIKNIDKKKAGKKAALTVGGHFLKGLAPAASLAEGMIKNEEGNRLESGLTQVYKDSALSYVEKGKELNLAQGAQFYLIFKPVNDCNDEPEEE